MRITSAAGTVALAAALALGGGATAFAAGSGGAVTDALGTHSAAVVDMAAGEVFAADGPCGSPSGYGGGFTTSLGNGFTYLVARSGPCRAGTGDGGYDTGERITVDREVDGEFICRSRLENRGSRVWFQTERGYVWSGGTQQARWKSGC